MVNRNLLRQYDLPENELEQELAAAFNQNVYEGGEAADWLPQDDQVFEVNKIVNGRVLNTGVKVYWPPSQVDMRRPPTIADYINKTSGCKTLKIDGARRNIVVSRRKLIEDQRIAMKEKLLAEIEPGQIRKGVVKNIA